MMMGGRPELLEGGAVFVGAVVGGRPVGGDEAVGCPPPRNGGNGIPVGIPEGRDGNGTEPNGLGKVVGAEFVVVPEGVGADVVPDGGGFGPVVGDVGDVGVD